ncbi:MAG: pilus assembly protein TadG-related protein [Acidimicrobiales bacterium]
MRTADESGRTAFRKYSDGVERDREQGSFTVFLAVLAVALFVLLGLVIDGGRAVAAQGAASGEAEQAARLGADQISVDAIRAGVVSIDPAAAVKVADAYLRAIGRPGVVTVVGQTVSVNVKSSEPTVILGMIGLEQIGISATASATNVHGVTRED